jgi:hypothetical protein
MISEALEGFIKRIKNYFFSVAAVLAEANSFFLFFFKTIS